MERDQAIETLKNSCSAISAELTRLHPAIPALGMKELQDELVKAVYQLTKDTETVKKLLRKAENQLDPEA